MPSPPSPLLQILPTPASVAWFLEQGRLHRAEAHGFYVLEPAPEGFNAESVVDANGVEHLSLTTPWPGRRGWIVGFRGTVCPVCRGARMAPHPPWVLPVVLCSCRKEEEEEFYHRGTEPQRNTEPNSNQRKKE